jgi:hypothetical protein
MKRRVSLTHGAPLAPIAPDQSDASPPGDCDVAFTREITWISYDFRNKKYET